MLTTQLLRVPESELDPLSREGTILVPGNQEWTKSAWLFMRVGSLRHFKLFDVPKPPPSDPVYGQGGQFRDIGRTRRKATGWYLSLIHI